NHLQHPIGGAFDNHGSVGSKGVANGLFFLHLVKLEDELVFADRENVAIKQFRLGDFYPVDVRTVGAVKVGKDVFAVDKANPAMTSRDRQIVDSDIIVARTSDTHDLLVERIVLDNGIVEFDNDLRHSSSA